MPSLIQHSENEDHGIQSHHFMGNRWGNSGNSVRLCFSGLQNTTDGDCSHEIKRCLFLGRKATINPDSVLKRRDITLLTKVCLDQAARHPRGGDWGLSFSSESLFLSTNPSKQGTSASLVRPPHTQMVFPVDGLFFTTSLSLLASSVR